MNAHSGFGSIFILAEWPFCGREMKVKKSPKRMKEGRARDPVPGILQARTLEWVAISFSNA